jgi:hypothetical protein
MYEITEDPNWLADAQSAKGFLYALWDDGLQCFPTGLDADCIVNNDLNQLPLDVQPWIVLAIPETLDEFPTVLQCAEQNHLTECTIPNNQLSANARAKGDLTLEGFDFNADRDGVWFEGTAHMATAYAYAGFDTRAKALRDVLNKAQQALPLHRDELPGPFQAPHGLVAGCADGISTGFGFVLMQRLHIGATAWNVFAQLKFNPYYQTHGPRP